MDLSDSNLGANSRLYKDIALSCIFMMNNGRSIVQKGKGSSEIHQMIGDTLTRNSGTTIRIIKETRGGDTSLPLLYGEGFQSHIDNVSVCNVVENEFPVGYACMATASNALFMELDRLL
ncbi:hypothetical protein SADUNF_Sadunf17G0068000 [Salix dunnii]|uniref:Exocyst subunit Exo70 family protein n=1 Tax=Salix dunnii TaxID=1413687 RepID=A0A835J5T2_9ROSI|nr:hypothetical protein SADUNF_Sadunf17G0068000 [Salix dunnii]